VEPVGLNANWTQNEREYSGLRNMGYRKDLTSSCTQPGDASFSYQYCSHLLLFCCAAINPEQPLPPPKWAAVELKQQAVDAISHWQEGFGKTYKKLSIAYNFLKSSKKVDFNFNCL